jgi:hypothetical protein
LAIRKNSPSVHVNLFLDGLDNKLQKEESWELYSIMNRLTGSNGKMWGTTIVGFGNNHYKYKSGNEGDWFLIGFSPRSNGFNLYLMGDIIQSELDKLGKYKKRKDVISFKKLSDINKGVLEQIIKSSIDVLSK